MRQRRIFFQYVLGSRRRQIRKWEEASVAQLFAIPNEFSLLRQRAQSSRLRLAIEDKGIPFYDAFRLFDHALNGLLSPAELWGALEWLGFNVAPDDVLDFMRSADKDNDGYISYREFTDMIRQPYDDEGGVETSALGSPTATGVGHLSASATRLQPKGEDILRSLKQARDLEESAEEEREAQRERDEERRIRERLLEAELEMDAAQAGGHNPKITNEQIYVDFTTRRRPRGVKSLDDIVYASDSYSTWLRVLRLGSLFLPLPFQGNGGGTHLNSYTMTMEILVEQLPSDKTALITIERHSQHPVIVFVNAAGQLGILDSDFAARAPVLLSGSTWHIVTFVVDVPAGTYALYIDGKGALEQRTPVMERFVVLISRLLSPLSREAHLGRKLNGTS
ncbi:EF-hand domain-containing protein [Plasmodiophora brassicae]|uniref:EF-hand domain-containing protein n=1 Tax=Plasmodiophora brassicae TaxID=37360 RepID=A0A3P3YP71_PLABS|nr:unnamed protein product [Plasmodiophora brassicae]